MKWVSLFSKCEIKRKLHSTFGSNQNVHANSDSSMEEWRFTKWAKHFTSLFHFFYLIRIATFYGQFELYSMFNEQVLGLQPTSHQISGQSDRLNPGNGNSHQIIESGLFLFNVYLQSTVKELVFCDNWTIFFWIFRNDVSELSTSFGQIEKRNWSGFECIEKHFGIQ